MTASVCESCGARLPGVSADAPPRKERPVRLAPAAPRVQAKKSGNTPRSRFEPWQVISGVAVLALVAVVAYTIVSDDRSAPPRTTTAMTPQPQVGGTSMAEVQALQQAVNANPDDHAARLRLANLLHDNGMLPQAIDNYIVYLEKHPQDPDARVDLGICYDQLALQDSSQATHYFTLAVREMETAAKQSPTHQPAAFNLGIVNLHMENLEASNMWLKRAVEMNRTSELGMRAEKILQQHSMIP